MQACRKNRSGRTRRLGARRVLLLTALAMAGGAASLDWGLAGGGATELGQKNDFIPKETDIRSEAEAEIAPVATLLVPTQDPRVGDGEVLLLGGRVELELVWISAGSFWIGCSPGDEDCDSDEKPRHHVQVDGFWMARYEVTQQQWAAVMGDETRLVLRHWPGGEAPLSNPSEFSSCGGDCPVESVSWGDVEQFLRKAEQGLRLPTEAEWEFAARGGTTTRYPWGQTFLCGNANAENDAGSDQDECVEWMRKRGLPVDGTVPVGRFEPNVHGLYDMIGNVWEWTADWYGSDSYARSSERNPKGLSSGSVRVFRGGSWNFSARHCRISDRLDSHPTGRFAAVGFRLARDVP